MGENEQINDAPRGNPKRSDYTVMFSFTDAETPEAALDQGEWKACGTYTVTNNNGQREARKQALDANPELRDRIEAGEAVWFLCLPVRSTHPFRSTLKQTEPQLVI